MNEADAGKKVEIPECGRIGNGGTVNDSSSRGSSVPTWGVQTGDDGSGLMDEVLQYDNLAAAYRRVVRNDGAAGVDGMTVDDLGKLPREHFTKVWEEMRNGAYQPQAVRRAEIPKPDGKGTRMLGIPTVMDRLIQQALLQRLQGIFEPTFSEGSFGFRPGRSTHQAVLRAREHVAAGYNWVVDLDLAKFFDRVDHDILMARVARRIKDVRVLRLIRRYLQAGIMEGGLVLPRSEGTPQGGPLSPLLSNILLDDLDRELERRGHRFVRYADDCNVYVRSEAAGKRVMASLEGFLEIRLRLKINRDKSAVARPWERKFLGYSTTAHRKTKLRIADQSLRRLKAKLRPILRRGRGRNLGAVVRELKPVIRGWVAYFRLAEVKGAFGELDRWVRRQLRCNVWRQWKTASTRFRELQRRGLDKTQATQSAYNNHGPWWNARTGNLCQAIPTKYLREQGLVSFIEEHRRLAQAS
jgi:RNA-directed DNA polymerase